MIDVLLIIFCRQGVIRSKRNVEGEKNVLISLIGVVEDSGQYHIFIQILVFDRQRDRAISLNAVRRLYPDQVQVRSNKSIHFKIQSILD